MISEICGSTGAVVRKATKSFGSGDSLVVIEGIPVVHCPKCHESYVTARDSPSVGQDSEEPSTDGKVSSDTRSLI